MTNDNENRCHEIFFVPVITPIDMEQFARPEEEEIPYIKVNKEERRCVLHKFHGGDCVVENLNGQQIKARR
ncbi:hypothetical protein SEA_LITTLEFELLA_68 [Gordonia phage LittleFella]|nr:hypothetical protein SEA_LITTLEFELLA_68 [Gordonia phage LittleFella]